MDESRENPFTVTRAADFTDQQIHEYWVDLADGGGFFELIKPRSEMPMLILGSKGSGKTHVMRYLSFALQQIRHSENLVAGIQQDGYLGIYMRCSGLNSARFRDKGQSEEVWANVFAYYMELWFAQLAVDACHEVAKHLPNLPRHEQPLISDARSLFDVPGHDFPNTLEGLATHLRQLQRELDIAINNCVIDRTLNVAIRATSGKLVFGMPQVLSKHLPALRQCIFLYLIDEFENLTATQQTFVNTLMRERQSPCSFKVGARLYGLRTSATFCADEENKEGSEYEQLPLDDRLRQNEERYTAFATRLVIKRLLTRGILARMPATDEPAKESLAAAFASARTEALAEDDTRFVVEKYEGRERPYFRILRQALEQGVKSDVTPGVESEDEITSVIERLMCPAFPLLEKLNCFIFYQHWSTRKHLPSAANAIAQECQEYVSDRNTTSKYHDTLLHFKYDLLAQLRRECDQKQQYVGFQTLVELSWGNPRHLLILLKHVYAWALFKGELPFGGTPISLSAQVSGVKEAAEWFFRDARMTGPDGKLVQDGIARLATLFRSIRYSHKPSECSVCTFSFNPSSVTGNTRRLIDLAEKWSLLVYVGGQRDRNSERVDAKLQLNRLLAPLWDISYNRRGVLPLPTEDVNAIFDPDHVSAFEPRLASRIARMTAPFFGVKPPRPDKPDTDQGILPGMRDD